VANLLLTWTYARPRRQNCRRGVCGDHYKFVPQVKM